MASVAIACSYGCLPCCAQAYYLNAPFPVERAPTVCFSARKRKRAVKVCELRQYPVRALVFEVGASLPELAAAVGRVCARLQDRNRPFNVLIADSGARVFVFPQCYAERQARGEVAAAVLDTQVNPAAWEISGHMVLKRREDYDTATQVRPAATHPIHMMGVQLSSAHGIVNAGRSCCELWVLQSCKIDW